MNFINAIIIFSQLLATAICANNKFPDEFLFGVSSSAYQIEGGYDSRGETTFDYYTHLNPALVADKSNAKIACDSYHLYKQDIALLDDLGVDFYRFSIAWSRILPKGYSNKINPEGIRYYNALIDGLLSKNIQPMVTMLHADLPKSLQDLGGWANPLMADLFEDYAGILFKNFGDRVKYWITMNVNYWGYDESGFPPRLNVSGIGEYLLAKNMLLGHSNVYRLYNREFRDEQKGQIGLTIDGKWMEAGSEAAEDVEAAERAREFMIGLMLNPIYGDGDFPKVVKERVELLSKREGFFRSRLPELSQEEQSRIKGSLDFLGLNVYTTFLAEDLPESSEMKPSLNKDLRMKIYQDPKWASSKSVWLKVVPSCMRNVLSWVKTKYNNPPVFITENGFSDDGQLDDVGRVDYLRLHLKSLLEAIHEDGVQVEGYAVWSLLDNFEWLGGYTEKFGLHHVDFTDPKRKRTPKSSAKWYKKFIEQRQLIETTPIKQEL